MNRIIGKASFRVKSCFNKLIRNNYIRERALFKSEKSEPKVMLPFSQEKKKVKDEMQTKIQMKYSPFL